MKRLFKITLALYGVVVAVNLVLRQVVLAGVSDPWATTGWGILLFFLALIWALCLLGWLVLRWKQLSRDERGLGCLGVFLVVVVVLFVSICWGSVGA